MSHSWLWVYFNSTLQRDFLVTKGTHTSLKNKYFGGNTAVHMAIRKCRPQIVCLLLSYYPLMPMPSIIKRKLQWI
ncbi:hypothetical protein MKW98_009610 [Papaver atlanticum]|uniref:Uncharacterized protein n=1 Tax=Papaver atlanticum TaxID=357466 RepID=A0AAD4XCA8_9MAGN|nr:hypothetical protein MKW98_009610 [Papaver atlanticum]